MPLFTECGDTRETREDDEDECEVEMGVKRDKRRKERRGDRELRKVDGLEKDLNEWHKC